MKRYSRIFFSCMAAALAFVACSVDDDFSPATEENTSSKVTVTATASQEPVTRTSYTDNSSEGTTTVTWASGDSFSVFLDATTQVPIEFTLSSGAGEQTGTFTGTFSTEPSSTDALYALYPSQGTYNTLTTEAVPFDIANQSGNLEDAQDNDFMWASSTYGSLSFSFSHLMSLIYYSITLPTSEAVSIISFASPTNDLITSGTIDMKTGTLTTSTTGTINVQEDATEQSTTSTTYTGYIIVAPQTTLTDLMVTAVSEDAQTLYQATVTLSDKGLTAGYRYSFSTTLSAVTLSSATSTITSDTSYEDQYFYYSSTSAGNIFKCTQNTLTLTDCYLMKYASSGSGGDESSFYGTYAALLSTGSGSCSFSGSGAATWTGNLGTINMYGGSITTDQSGANAIVAYGGTVNIKNVAIHTYQGASRGLHATYNGVINAENCSIITEGTSCSVIATDRGYGTVTVDGGYYEARGNNSAVLYSTGEITASNIKGESEVGEIGVIEGSNSITINNSEITSGSSKRALMILQSGSGDSSGSDGYIYVNGGKLTSTGSSTPLLEVPTSITGTLTLNNVEVSCASGILMYVDYNTQWSTSGGTGNLILEGGDYEYTGRVYTDSYGYANVTLSDSAVWNGYYTDGKSTASGTITIDSGCTWNLTGNTTVATIINNGTINCNGYTLTYSSKSGSGTIND
jgi:hypothetical protein